MTASAGDVPGDDARPVPGDSAGRAGGAAAGRALPLLSLLPHRLPAAGAAAGAAAAAGCHRRRLGGAVPAGAA